jgi:hypothetical protein
LMEGLAFVWIYQDENLQKWRRTYAIFMCWAGLESESWL